MLRRRRASAHGTRRGRSSVTSFICPPRGRGCHVQRVPTASASTLARAALPTRGASVARAARSALGSGPEAPRGFSREGGRVSSTVVSQTPRRTPGSRRLLAGRGFATVRNDVLFAVMLSKCYLRHHAMNLFFHDGIAFKFLGFNF